MIVRQIAALTFFTIISTFSPACYAEKKTTIIEPQLILQPNETKSVTIQAEDGGITEIYWQILDGKINGEDCQTSPCVRVYDKNLDYTAETYNYQREFETNENPLVLELTNIADTPVTIEIRRSLNICIAQSCEYFTSSVSDEWDAVRVQTFSNNTLAKDASYSQISGSTIDGTSFDDIFVWWTYDQNSISDCKEKIAQWIDDPQAYPPPYILAGKKLPPSEKNKNSLTLLVDTCIPDAKDYIDAEKDENNEHIQHEE